MIFTECTKCEKLIVYGYEAGDKPCGKGVYGKVICESCGGTNYIERVSMDGETLDEDSFRRLKKYTTGQDSRYAKES